MNLRDLSKKICLNKEFKCPLCESILNIKNGQTTDTHFDNEWFECCYDKNINSKSLIHNNDYVSFFLGYLYFQKYGLYIANENYYIRYMESYCSSNKDILKSSLYLYNEFENITLIEAGCQMLDLSTEAPFVDIEKIKTLLLFQ